MKQEKKSNQLRKLSFNEAFFFENLLACELKMSTKGEKMTLRRVVALTSVRSFADSQLSTSNFTIVYAPCTSKVIIRQLNLILKSRRWIDPRENMADGQNLLYTYICSMVHE